MPKERGPKPPNLPNQQEPTDRQTDALTEAAPNTPAQPQMETDTELTPANAEKVKRTTQKEPGPKNWPAAAAAKRTAANSDANEHTHTQLENDRAEGRATASPRPGNERPNSTTSTAKGAGQPTNDRRTRVDIADLFCVTTSQEQPRLFLSCVACQGWRIGVWGVPRYKSEARFPATRAALDARSHNKTAGVALRRLSAPLGGGDIDRRRRESRNKLRSNLISLFRVSNHDLLL